MAGGRESVHRRGNQIIRLDATLFDNLKPEESRQALDLRQLQDDILRGLIALSLVFREDGKVPIRAAQIEKDGKAIGLLGFAQIEQ